MRGRPSAYIWNDFRAASFVVFSDFSCSFATESGWAGGAAGVERKLGARCCRVFKGIRGWVCQEEEEEVAAFRSSFRSIVSPSHLELA